jgi:hypothetical protein
MSEPIAPPRRRRFWWARCRIKFSIARTSFGSMARFGNTRAFPAIQLSSTSVSHRRRFPYAAPLTRTYFSEQSMLVITTLSPPRFSCCATGLRCKDYKPPAIQPLIVVGVDSAGSAKRAYESIGARSHHCRQQYRGFGVRRSKRR